MTTTDQAKQREMLTGQVQHLVEEIEAMLHIAAALPDEILSVSPLPDEPSLKELYALIGLYDRDVYEPAIRAMLAENKPTLYVGDDRELLSRAAWNDETFDVILDFVRRKRKELLALLQGASPEEWKRTASLGARTLTVNEVVYAITQHDAQILRAAALRLHDSRWVSP
jgi:hypothetical protein